MAVACLQDMKGSAGVKGDKTVNLGNFFDELFMKLSNKNERIFVFSCLMKHITLVRLSSGVFWNFVSSHKD